MNWSLMTRLRLGFAASFVLFLAVCLTTWWIASEFARSSRKEQSNIAATVALAEAESALWQLRYGLPQFMVGDAEARQRIIADEKKWYAVVESRLEIYAGTLHERASEQRSALSELRAAYLRYKAARPKFFELYATGQIEDALAWRALTTAPYGAAMVKAFERQIELVRAHVAADLVRDSEGVARVRLAVVVVGVLLLSLLVLGYRGAQGTLRPIRALRAQAQAMVREQLGEPVDVSPTRNEVTALLESFELMAARLSAYTESLRQARARLDYLITTAPVVIYALRAGGNYGATFLSENVRQLFGYGPEAFTAEARLWASRIHPDDRDRVIADLHQAFVSGERRHEYRFCHQDGSWRWIHDEMVLARDSAGVAREFVGFMMDVTERKQVEEALKQANALVATQYHLLEHANRSRAEFMNNITHELRTPLNAVIGFSELLKDEVAGPLNAQQAECAADILGSGLRLLALVEGILEMTRLDAAGVELVREPVDIDAVLAQRVAAQRKAADACGVTLQLHVAPDTGSVELNAETLQRVLDALLDNAVKFNREGGTVAVSARRAGDRLEIAVTDTGIGIAHDDLARLFQPLVQLDAGLARRHGGIGLGLALARRLAEVQGGTIDVESEPGKGSTFTLRLPMQEK